ncbi:hypothetical protein [uncultured Hymenobacter sp.]|uniref:hypothetical protein n=1 Tax=uncultured Hymenobacter sp. TaxID=170016 RepID=UPI0035CAE0A8
MRLIFIVIGWLLPQVLLAQFNSFEPGSYVLHNSPTVRHQSSLKFQGGDEFMVKDANGNRRKLTVSEVSSFRIGPQKYIAVGRFAVGSGLRNSYVERAFVAQVDSGRVGLLFYEYDVYAGLTSFGASDKQIKHLYLLQKEFRMFPIPNHGSLDNKTFRAALSPHLQERPDMIKLLEEKRMCFNDMPLVVRALNTGQPMPTLPTYWNR